MAVRIESVLESLRPIFEKDGGAIKFVKEEGGTVFISLHGACVGCPMSMYTLKLGVEKALKEQIPSIKEVVPL